MKAYLKALFTPEMPEDIGTVNLEWRFPEYIRVEHNRWWYIGMAALFGSLILYSVLTANVLFAIILVLMVFIIIFQYFQPARSISIIIGEDGIILDKRFYSYKILKSFWLVYDPPEVKYLYLDFKNQMKKSLPIPLEEINPLAVREVLLNYLEENLNKEEEELDETVARLFDLR